MVLLEVQEGLGVWEHQMEVEEVGPHLEEEVGVDPLGQVVEEGVDQPFLGEEGVEEVHPCLVVEVVVVNLLLLEEVEVEEVLLQAL